MKKRFIATILIAAVSITGCATKKNAERFGITATELVETMSDEFLLNLEHSDTIDDTENDTKISVYSWRTYENQDKPFYYQISYDDTSEKVSHISFFFNKSIEDARIYYLLHIGAIAEILQPGIDTEAVFDAISNVNDNADVTEMYEGENFNLFASCGDVYFNASFSPIEKYK